MKQTRRATAKMRKTVAADKWVRSECEDGLVEGDEAEMKLK